jgi:hypothetical protein
MTAPETVRDVVTVRREEAPTIDIWWTDPKNFSIVLMGRWEREEHINLLEARAALMAVRRAARSRSAWRKKILLVSDSKVTMGAFGKGRSSSHSLLRVCRRLGSIQLGLRMRIRVRYVHTSKNVADGPSRGQKFPGVFIKKGKT